MAVVATATVVVRAEFDCFAAEAAAVVDELLEFLDGHCEVRTGCQSISGLSTVLSVLCRLSRRAGERCQFEERRTQGQGRSYEHKLRLTISCSKTAEEWYRETEDAWV